MMMKIFIIEKTAHIRLNRIYTEVSNEHTFVYNRQCFNVFRRSVQTSLGTYSYYSFVVFVKHKFVLLSVLCIDTLPILVQLLRNHAIVLSIVNHAIIKIDVFFT